MDATIGVIVQYFLLSLSFGIGIFSIIVETKPTGIGFIKLLNNVALVSLVILFIVIRPDYFSTESIPFYLGLILFGLGQFFHQNRNSVFFWFLFGLQNIILLYLYNNLLRIDDIFALLYLLSGGLLIGIITYSMLLGHWYLVVPGLSEKYLKRALIVFWALFAFKLLLSTIGLMKGQSFYVTGSNLGMGHMFNWVMLVMRLVWGYLMIGILGIFAWKLVKMRSIQSATGILYVMTFLVFAGELIACFFHYKYGLYL